MQNELFRLSASKSQELEDIEERLHFEKSLWLEKILDIRIVVAFLLFFKVTMPSVI